MDRLFPGGMNKGEQMKFVYIDETIHRDFGFMMLSFVSCDNDPQEDVKRILVASGARKGRLRYCL